MQGVGRFEVRGEPDSPGIVAGEIGGVLRHRGEDGFAGWFAVDKARIVSAIDAACR